MENKITVKQASKLVGRSTKTIYNWVNEGLTNYGKEKGILLDKKEVLDFFELKQSKKIELNETNEEGGKLCNKCGRHFPATHEYFNRRKDGFQSICRECNQEACKKFRENNTTYAKEYYENNKDKQMITNHRNQASRLGLEATFTLEDWYEMSEHFNYECAYCGDKNNNQLEHIIPKVKGGAFVKGNIIRACSKCNASKFNNDLETWGAKNVSEEKMKKIKEYREKYFVDKLN